MLGGGNPVSSSNPAGTGTSVNYVGNHAYGYSGTVQANSTDAIALKFETSNAYIIGKISITADNDTLGTNFLKFTVNIDGQPVMQSRERRDLGAIQDYPIPILIPPNAKIEMKFPANGTDADISWLFVGRVYN